MTDRAKSPTSVRGWIAVLRQRRVLRVLAVYLVGAWLALQVADVALLPALGVPELGMRYLVIAAAIGLAIAFLLSWRYQISAQGIVRHDLGIDGSNVASALHPSDRWVIAALGGAALLVAGATALKLADLAGDAQADTKAPVDAQPAPAGSLAVLPFANLSDDPKMDYLGDGLAEELLNRLAKVPSLRVTARTSAFSFKGRADATVQDIGHALGVAHVLEGSVRRSNDALRITVQLVDTANGYHVWSNTYDRTLSDVFAIQDDIAQTVLESLRVVLTPKQKTVLIAHGTNEPEVLDLYLRARQLTYERMDVAGLEAAIRYLRDVTERDPSFAAAYVTLAEAVGTQAQMRGDPTAFGLDSERRRLLETALKLDPSNADAHAILGIAFANSMDLESSRREFALAEALNPNGELVLRYLSRYYGYWGWPPEKAIDYALRGQQLDPLNPWAIINLAIAYSNADQFTQSLLAVDRTLEVNPSFWVGWWHRDWVLFELGRYAEAVEAARRALELSDGYVDVNADLIVMLAAAGHQTEADEIFRRMEAPNQRPRWRPSARAIALAGLGRHDEALLAIEEAIRAGDGTFAELLGHRLFVPLHDEPRFMRIVKELEQERRVERVRQRLKLES